MLSRVFSWIVFLAAIGVFVYVFQIQVKDGMRQIYLYAFPCSLPVTYKLGSVDPRFGISTSTLEKDLSTAASLWNKAAGKNLISEDEKSGLVTVSLVYDSRQEMTQRLRGLGITLSDDRSSYDALKVRYDSMYAQYQTQKNQFDADVASFEASRQSYQKQVDYWNARGGAPRDEYVTLQNQQAALSQQSARLQQEQDSVNSVAQDVNDLARALNQLISALNLDVQKYNTTGLHIYVPLGAKYSYEQAKQFAKLVTELVHGRLPAITSLEHDPKKREGRIYLDIERNAIGQTAAAVYCIRPFPGATVSTPLEWREVKKGLDPADFTIKTVHKRLKQKGDLFKPVLKKGVDLASAVSCLEEELKQL